MIRGLFLDDSHAYRMIDADRNFYQPREALLKYAQLAEEDPQWTAGMSFLLVLF